MFQIDFSDLFLNLQNTLVGTEKSEKEELIIT